jgi:hypothetical protein
MSSFSDIQCKKSTLPRPLAEFTLQFRDHGRLLDNVIKLNLVKKGE